MEEISHVKKYFLIAFIVSLSISALIGIFVFLLGNFGSTEIRILGTTFSIVVFSLTALSCAALYDKNKKKILAMSGMIISGITFFYAVLLIWEIMDFGSELTYKSLFTLLVLTIWTAHASLLLLIDNQNKFVRGSLWTTLVLTSIVALFIILVIYEILEFEEFILRLFGTLVILDALGTLVTPILNKIYKGGSVSGSVAMVKPALAK